MTEIPTNETPDPVQSVFHLVTTLFSTYGWSILFFLVLINLLWSHFYPKYRSWKERLEDESTNAQHKKDPSYLIAREEAIARARQNLQEKHDQLSQEHLVKMKEKEEKKRQEKIAEMEKLLHGKPKSENKPRTLRDEYNPLTSTNGGSCSYRPSRRGNTGGG